MIIGIPSCSMISMIKVIAIRSASHHRRYPPFTPSRLLHREIPAARLRRRIPDGGSSIIDHHHSNHHHHDRSISSSSSSSAISSDQQRRRDSNTTTNQQHDIDRLDPSDWVLIYYNPTYDRSRNMIPPMIIFGLLSVLILTFALIIVVPDLKYMKYETGDLLFLGWPIGIGSLATALTMYRRRFVISIYRRSSMISSSNDNRRCYCVVWLNWRLARRKFEYDQSETSQAREVHPILAGFTGNYKARNRDWHVRAVYFNQPMDYFNVRVRSSSR